MIIFLRLIGSSASENLKKIRKSLIYDLISKHKKKLILGFSLGLLSICFNWISSTFLIPSMVKFFDPNQKIQSFERVELFFSQFFEINQSFRFVFFIIVLFFMILKSFTSLLRDRNYTKLSNANGMYLKSKVLEHLMRKKLNFFIREGTSFVSNHLNFKIGFSSEYLSSLQSVVLNGIALCGFLFLAAWTSPKLFFILCLSYFPFYFINNKIKEKIKNYWLDYFSKNQKMDQLHLDFFSGIRYLKLANLEKKTTYKILSFSKALFFAKGKQSFFASISLSINELFGVSFLVILACSMFFTNTLSGSDISIFFGFLFLFLRCLQSYNGVLAGLNGLVAQKLTLESLENFFSDKSEMDTGWGAEGLSSFADKIVLRDLEFRYPHTHKNVLNSINITIPLGKQIALVGPSGSGKSTLIDLILGFYSPTSGEIFLDGKSYKNYKLDNYRRLFGLVSQEAHMFLPTIRENLVLFKSDASDDELRSALSKADILEFVESLSEGLDTVIGERGVKLSGGQKQRLSIARALLHAPEILIFDEATSSLDSLSEARIIESIKKASVGRTTITIAHRLSTVMHCDRVIFLENGWVIEEGSPQELMQKQSRFRKYAEAQNLGMKMSG